MSVTRSLTFLWTPWTAALSVVAVAGHGRLLLHRLAAERLSRLDGVARAAAAGARRDRRRAAQPARMDRGVPPRGEAGDRRAAGTPRPAWTPATSSRPTSRPARPTTRQRGDRAVADPASWDKLREADERGDPAVLAGRSARGGRRPAAPTPRRPAAAAPTCSSRCAPERIGNLRGVVLASDGDWNEGPPPVQAAARLRIKRRADLRRAGRQPHPAARRRAPEPRRARPSASRASRCASRSRSTARCRATT